MHLVLGMPSLAIQRRPRLPSPGGARRPNARQDAGLPGKLKVRAIPAPQRALGHSKNWLVAAKRS